MSLLSTFGLVWFWQKKVRETTWKENRVVEACRNLNHFEPHPPPPPAGRHEIAKTSTSRARDNSYLSSLSVWYGYNCKEQAPSI